MGTGTGRDRNPIHGATTVARHATTSTLACVKVVVGAGLRENKRVDVRIKTRPSGPDCSAEAAGGDATGDAPRGRIGGARATYRDADIQDRFR